MNIGSVFIKWVKRFGLLLVILVLPVMKIFGSRFGYTPTLFNIRYEFVFFVLTLLGVLMFSKYSTIIAVLGLIIVIGFKASFVPDFSFYTHFLGDADKEGEIYSLVNLVGLLLGFAILAKHFEDSKLPDILPNYLPNDWKGGFFLLMFIMILATFLDSIASAMIGGAIALIVFKGRVHIGYLVAIVAASNGGGAGSVLGNMPTTMMWIDGVDPVFVTRAFVGSIVALLIFGVIASIQQDRYQRIQRDATVGVRVDRGRLMIVIMILVFAIVSNWIFKFPALGVWGGILIGALFRKTSWQEIPKSIQGTLFLAALVTSASLMPVSQLPKASWQSSFGLGFISAVFDNIPLTKLCLIQGGYDWGILAFTIGFGGSMIWFGSSAGVALSNMFPQAKSVTNYIKGGWHVILAYVVGFFIMLNIVGWKPLAAEHKNNLSIKQKEVNYFNTESVLH